jgi:hypothetical protein
MLSLPIAIPLELIPGGKVSFAFKILDALNGGKGHAILGSPKESSRRCITGRGVKRYVSLLPGASGTLWRDNQPGKLSIKVFFNVQIIR